MSPPKLLKYELFSDKKLTKLAMRITPPSLALLLWKLQLVTVMFLKPSKKKVPCWLDAVPPIALFTWTWSMRTYASGLAFQSPALVHPTRHACCTAPT